MDVEDAQNLGEEAIEGDAVEQQGEWGGETTAGDDGGGDDVYGDNGVATADEQAGLELEAEEYREQQGFEEQPADMYYDAEPEAERPPSQRMSGTLRAGETMKDVGGPTRTARTGPLDRTRVRVEKHQERLQAKQVRLSPAGCLTALLQARALTRATLLPGRRGGCATEACQGVLPGAPGSRPRCCKVSQSEALRAAGAHGRIARRPQAVRAPIVLCWCGFDSVPGPDPLSSIWPSSFRTT